MDDSRVSDKGRKSIQSIIDLIDRLVGVSTCQLIVVALGLCHVMSWHG
jgi:hypothetical protein